MAPTAATLSVCNGSLRVIHGVSQKVYFLFTSSLRWKWVMNLKVGYLRLGIAKFAASDSSQLFSKLHNGSPECRSKKNYRYTIFPLLDSNLSEQYYWWHIFYSQIKKQIKSFAGNNLQAAFHKYSKVCWLKVSINTLDVLLDIENRQLVRNICATTQEMPLNCGICMLSGLRQQMSIKKMSKIAKRKQKTLQKNNKRVITRKPLTSLIGKLLLFLLLLLCFCFACCKQ